MAVLSAMVRSGRARARPCRGSCRDSVASTSPTTRHRPCSASTAAMMRPARICAPRLGFAAIERVARRDGPASGGTWRVTSRSPRSLSSRTDARRRADDARVVDVDGVGDDRRRRIGARGGRRSTVTASAMPSEKLRPRQPEVATPRTGDDAATVKRPSSGAPKRPRIGSAHRPTSNDVAGARRKAMSPPLLTDARATPARSNDAISSSATLPATAAIAVMKRPSRACGAAGGDHAPRDGAARLDRPRSTRRRAAAAARRPARRARRESAARRARRRRSTTSARPRRRRCSRSARAGSASGPRRARAARAPLIASSRSARRAATARRPPRRRRASRRPRARRRAGARAPCGRRARGSRRPSS